MTYNMNLESVGASLQVRQELLRHSDPRLTAGTYMDGTRLETASLIEKLPDYMDGNKADTQLDAQATGATSLIVSHAVTTNGSLENAGTIANIEESHSLSPVVAGCHNGQLETMTGFESPPSPPVFMITK